jgi:hypothetical protein
MDEESPTPSLEVQLEMASRYAAAMHLAANRKVGVTARWLLIAGAAAAFFMHSLWPLGAAFALSVAVYFYLMNSCARFVERAIGMPPDAQAAASRRYKVDKEFARHVDAMSRAPGTLNGP